MAQQKKNGRSYRTEIIIALIGMIGVLGGALFANWDKIFNQGNNGSTSVSVSPAATDTETRHGPETTSKPETVATPEPDLEPEATPRVEYGTPINTETENAPAPESISSAIDVRGIWLSPGQNISYNFTQNGQDITWDVRENSDKGTGKVEGKTFAFNVYGERVVYQVAKRDSNGKPVVIYTIHPRYAQLVLFRTCDDFKRFLRDVDQFPEWKVYQSRMINNTQVHRCPEALE